jgi:hypothetical protein
LKKAETVSEQKKNIPYRHLCKNVKKRRQCEVGKNVYWKQREGEKKSINK